MSRRVVERLYDELARSIRAGAFRAGDQFPTEMTLSAEYEVARSTVREALKLLEQDGLLVLKWGKGRYVSASATLVVDRPVTRLESVTELTAELGLITTTEVLSVGEVWPAAEEQQALQLALGSPVIRLERLRLSGPCELIYSVDTFGRHAISQPIDDVDWSGSLFELLTSAGLEPVSSTVQFRAVPAPRSIEGRVIDDSVVWLLADETCVTASGEPVVYSRTYYRGDNFSFNVLRERD